MKVKDLAAVLDDKQYVELYYDREPTICEYGGIIGNLNNDRYLNSEINEMYSTPRILRPDLDNKDDNETILRVVTIVVIEYGK